MHFYFQASAKINGNVINLSSMWFFFFHSFPFVFYPYIPPFHNCSLFIYFLFTLQGWRTSGKIWSKGHPPFRCCSLSNQKSDIVTYLDIAITMINAWRVQYERNLANTPGNPNWDCPLPEYLFGEFLHCVTNQVEHGAREINNVWSPGWHNIISILDYDDGRE